MYTSINLRFSRPLDFLNKRLTHCTHFTPGRPVVVVFTLSWREIYIGALDNSD